jgi:hypothetical protein
MTLGELMGANVAAAVQLHAAMLLSLVQGESSNVTKRENAGEAKHQKPIEIDRGTLELLKPINHALVRGPDNKYKFMTRFVCIAPHLS